MTRKVLEKYQAAIEKKGMISSDGLYVDWLCVRQGTVMNAKAVITCVRFELPH